MKQSMLVMELLNKVHKLLRYVLLPPSTPFPTKKEKPNGISSLSFLQVGILNQSEGFVTGLILTYLLVTNLEFVIH